MSSGRQERVNVSAEPPVDEAPLATVTVAIVGDDDAIGHVLAKAGCRIAEAATGGRASVSRRRRSRTSSSSK